VVQAPAGKHRPAMISSSESVRPEIGKMAARNATRAGAGGSVLDDRQRVKFRRRFITVATAFHDNSFAAIRLLALELHELIGQAAWEDSRLQIFERPHA
jgi:hypothetical protein